MESIAKKLAEYKKLAQEGDVNAQLRLAGAYLYGSAGVIDPVESMRWCAMALQTGHPLAKFFYGQYHFQGQGVPKDFSIAFRWWHEAAVDGNGEGQALTAWAYDQGVGVERNAALAAEWWLKAAHEGIVNAQLSIATCYEEGTGVGKDISTAAFWYMIAERNHSKDPNKNLARLLEKFEPSKVAEIKQSVDDFIAKYPRCIRKAANYSGPAFIV